MDKLFNCHTKAGVAENTPIPTERWVCADDSGNGLIPLSSILQDTLENSRDISAEDKVYSSVMTGVEDINDLLMGMQPGDLILIASRPGMGKTGIALNMAVAAAKETGKAVAIFSLEMSRRQLAMRLLAGESHIGNGRLTSDDRNKLLSAADTLSKLDIRIDDNPIMTVMEMSSQCRRVDNLGLIVVDYLQLMQSFGSDTHRAGMSRRQAVSDISRMMKVTAKELDVPVLCLSQLSRAVESRTNKRPMLSDLRESGSVEQDADTVIGLYRNGYYDTACEDPNLVEAIILKNRRGCTGTVYLRRLPVDKK